MFGQRALAGALGRLENHPGNDLSDGKLRTLFSEGQSNLCWGQGYYNSWHQGK